MNISSDITEIDINNWATVVNTFSLDISVEEIKQHTKWKESRVLFTDSEDDVGEMDAKMKLTNANAKKSFSFCIQQAEKNNIDMHEDIYYWRG